MRFRLEYGALLAAAAWVRLLPVPVSRRLLRGAGHAFFLLSGRYRRVALENLLHIFPLPEECRRRRALARASFAHLGTLLFDLLHLSRVPAGDLERETEVRGWDHLENAYRRGRGVLLFSAHFGNWERVALLQGFRGYRLNLITRPLDNPYLESYLRRIRTRSGNRVLPKRGAIRRCLRPIRAGEGIALVIDQWAPVPEAVFVNFLGRPAATTRTLARLALRFRCAVVPVFSVPLPDGRWRIVYEPEISLPETGSQEQRIRSLTQECTAVIERYVRRHPEYWFWMHRRWRAESPLPLPLPGGASADA